MMQGSITTVPPEIFCELAVHTDLKSFVYLGETSISFHAWCKDDGLWRRKTGKDYELSILPERFKTWRDFYIYLTVPRKIEARFCDCLVLTLSYSSKVEEEIRHATVDIHNDSIQEWNCQDQYSLELIAVSEKYPYKLKSQEDWEKAYVEGIIEISWVIEQGDKFPLGIFILREKAKEKTKVLMYDSELGIADIFTENPMMVNVDYGEVYITIPELIYTSIFPDEVPTEESKFPPGTRYDENTPMKEVLSSLGYKKNYQGYYPNIYGDMVVK